MPLILDGGSARIVGLAVVEDAERLLEWIQEHPTGALDLAACSHVHTAVLQVIVARIPAFVPPTDPDLLPWLLPSTSNPTEGRIPCRNPS